MNFVVEPDPAWDAYDEQDGVLVVELSWPPDALAGRLEHLVVSPALAADLTGHEITGFSTGPARGVYDEDQTMGLEPGDTPPPLLRLIPGDDPAADIGYEPRQGLIVSERALAVLKAHCPKLSAEALPA